MKLRGIAAGALVAGVGSTTLSCDAGDPLQPSPLDAFHVVVVDSLVVNRGGTNTFVVTMDTNASLGLSALRSGFIAAIDGGTVSVSASANASTTPFDLIVTAAAGAERVSRRVVVRAQDPPPKTSVTVRVCNHAWNGPGTVYFRNEGERWQAATANADLSVTFDATERVALRYAFSYPSSYLSSVRTRVIYARATELAQLDCPPWGGTRAFVAGPTANVSSYLASVGGWRTFNGGYAPGQNYAGPGPLDLVATGLATIPGSATTVRRAIVKRSLPFAASATLPMLDFGGSEAVDLDSAALTAPAGVAQFGTWVQTATTVHRIVSPQPRDWTFALPPEVLQPGDIHIMQFSMDGRGEQRYYREATPTTVSLGPALTVPSGDLATGVSTLDSQAEYGDIAGISYWTYSDGRGGSNSVEVWMTKGYAGGTPTTWTFLPRHFDGLVLPGYGTRSPASGTGPIGLYLDATAAGGRPMLLFGAKGADGEALRFAKSGGTNNTMTLWVPYPVQR